MADSSPLVEYFCNECKESFWDAAADFKTQHILGVHVPPQPLYCCSSCGQEQSTLAKAENHNHSVHQNMATIITREGEEANLVAEWTKKCFVQSQQQPQVFQQPEGGSTLFSAVEAIQELPEEPEAYEGPFDEIIDFDENIFELDDEDENLDFNDFHETILNFEEFEGMIQEAFAAQNKGIPLYSSSNTYINPADISLDIDRPEYNIDRELTPESDQNANSNDNSKKQEDPTIENKSSEKKKKFVKKKLPAPISSINPILNTTKQNPADPNYCRLCKSHDWVTYCIDKKEHIFKLHMKKIAIFCAYCDQGASNSVDLYHHIKHEHSFNPKVCIIDRTAEYEEEIKKWWLSCFGTKEWEYDKDMWERCLYKGRSRAEHIKACKKNRLAALAIKRQHHRFSSVVEREKDPKDLIFCHVCKSTIWSLYCPKKKEHIFKAHMKKAIFWCPHCPAERNNSIDMFHHIKKTHKNKRLAKCIDKTEDYAIELNEWWQACFKKPWLGSEEWTEEMNNKAKQQEEREEEGAPAKRFGSFFQSSCFRACLEPTDDSEITITSAEQYEIQPLHNIPLTEQGGNTVAFVASNRNEDDLSPNFVCKLCKSDKWIENSSDKLEHVSKEHLKIFLYYCSICTRSFNSIVEAAEHTRNNHETRAVINSNIRRHRRLLREWMFKSFGEDLPMTEEEIKLREETQRRFAKTKERLDSFRLAAERKKREETYPLNWDLIYYCNVCKSNQWYNPSLDKEYHITHDHMKRPFYTCSACPYMGFQRATVQMHIQSSHGGHGVVHSLRESHEVAYSEWQNVCFGTRKVRRKVAFIKEFCKVCNRELFNQQLDRKVHILTTHMKLKTFFCKFCAFGHMEENRVTFHMRNKHHYESTPVVLDEAAYKDDLQSWMEKCFD